MNEPGEIAGQVEEVIAGGGSAGPCRMPPGRDRAAAVCLGPADRPS